MSKSGFTPEARFMEEALVLARDCGAEHPVGAVVVKDGEILSSACNQSHLHDDTTYHAEKLAIAGAKIALDARRLDGCDLYSTMEPCTLVCAGLIVANNVSNVVYATSADKARIFSEKNPDMGWSTSGIPLAEFLQRQSADPPAVFGNFMQEKGAELLQLTPRSAESCLSPAGKRLHIEKLQAVGPKLTRVKFRIGEQSYDMEAPFSPEVLLSWFPDYAAKAPHCGECDRLILPGQLVAVNQGFSHAFCRDSADCYAGWLDNNAQLVPALK